MNISLILQHFIPKIICGTTNKF